MLPTSRKEINKYQVFSKGLLNEIEQKANQSSLVGFVDTDCIDSVDGKIVVLKTADLREAVENLQRFDITNIRWFINMDSLSINILSFSRYLENLYRSAGYNPTINIEYVACYGNKWIPIKKQDGFLVTTFSEKSEKYFQKSAISGRHATLTYTFLLSLAKLYSGGFSKYIHDKFDLNVLHASWEKYLTEVGNNQKQKVDENHDLVQFNFLQIQPLSHLKIIVNVLWDQLEDEEKIYLKERINEGLDGAESLALLMSLTDTSLSDISFNVPSFVDTAKINLIVDMTLSDDVIDKKGSSMVILQEKDWGCFPMHPIFLERVEGLLHDYPRWTQWLHDHLNLPLNTTQDWQVFLTSALLVHHSSLDQFIQVTGYKIIGPLEHKKYLTRLLDAQRMVAMSYSAAIEYYLMCHSDEHVLIRQLNRPVFTVFVERVLSQEDQANSIYTFLSDVAVAYNRLEPSDVPIEEEVGPEFESRHLDEKQSIIISQHLRHLIHLLVRMPNSDIYLRALIDAYHELHFTGHNPSISVHNVLMDNKYHIHHRDVNFVRVARRSAKQIDMIIDEYGEIVRDKIVEDMKRYLQREYQRLVNPKWNEEAGQAEHVVAASYKAINLQRIEALLKRLQEQKLLTERERRAQIHLFNAFLSAKRYIQDLPETHAFFEKNCRLTVWDEMSGDPKKIFPSLALLVSKIISKDEVEIELVDPFAEARDQSKNAHLTLSFKSPYDEITLDSSQYPVVVNAYLDCYGAFILKVADEAIKLIEWDAVRFRSSSEQLILLTGEKSGVLVGADNDKICHLTVKTSNELEYYINKAVNDYVQNYVLTHGDVGEYSKENLLKKWLKGRKWIVEISQDTTANIAIRKQREYLEKQYQDDGLKPQEYIVYVGFPDSPLMKEKERNGYLVRSASNTKSAYYWPAIGYPEIIKNLPITYFNLLSFSWRYPKKMELLFRLIREKAKTSSGLVNTIPTDNRISKEIVKEAYQQQLEVNHVIDYEALYYHISRVINPESTDACLTETQIMVVNAYVKLFRSLESFLNVEDIVEKIEWPTDDS